MTSIHDDETPSSFIDNLLLADRAPYWRAIHRMSSAGYTPTLWTGVFGTPRHKVGGSAGMTPEQRAEWVRDQARKRYRDSRKRLAMVKP